jgi:hypothetical protein
MQNNLHDREFHIGATKNNMKIETVEWGRGQLDRTGEPSGDLGGTVYKLPLI